MTVVDCLFSHGDVNMSRVPFMTVTSVIYDNLEA